MELTRTMSDQKMTTTEDVFEMDDEEALETINALERRLNTARKMSTYTHNGKTVTADEKIIALQILILRRQVDTSTDLIEQQRQRLNDAAATIKSHADRVKEAYEEGYEDGECRMPGEKWYSKWMSSDAKARLSNQTPESNAAKHTERLTT